VFKHQINEETKVSYQAPLKDMLFVMNELAQLPIVNQLPGCEDATLDTVEAVLEENARFCGEVIAPLNHPSDKEPSFWHDGQVTTSNGFKEAFKGFVEAGWQGVQHPAEFGGQGLPKIVATPCIEMLHASSLSFALVALLTDGAIEALLTAGSSEQKALYLEPLISGRWTYDEPDRTAGRFRPGRRSQPRRASGRWYLQGVRHQDLHHLRRA